jgi:hypothetical protein
MLTDELHSSQKELDSMIAKLIERIRKGPRWRYRSAVTGRYVSKIYALLHPDTTYKARVR